MSALEALLGSIKDARKAIGAVDGKQVFSRALLRSLHTLADAYFAEVRPFIASRIDDTRLLADADSLFQLIASLSRRNPSKDKCLSALGNAKDLLVTLEGLSLAHGANRGSGTSSRADELIVTTLRDICPSSALAYQQALIDLQQPQRHSWRGPATDLREALRETLDVLAPDAEVERMAGYKPEPDAKRPTMKQKTRYILRNRGLGSGQLVAPESAITGLEDMIGGLTRSVYTRSSVSTHTPTTKDEVLRVHAWVRLVLCELLELPAS